MKVTAEDVHRIATGHHPDPARSMSLRAEAYVEPLWADFEDRAVFSRTWQWICHVGQLTEPGSYVASTVAGMPIVVVRDRTGILRAFYNVCKHRAHELLTGSGVTRNIVCPYHAWTYDLSGDLKAALGTGRRQADARPQTHVHDRLQLEERRRQLPRVLPLPHRAPGVRGPRRHGHLRREDARHLVEPLRRSRQTGEQRVRRVRRDGQPARRVVAVAQHVPAALPRQIQLHGAADPPGRPGPHARDVGLLLRDRRPDRRGVGRRPVHRRGVAAAGHRHRGERATRDAHAGCSIRGGSSTTLPGPGCPSTACTTSTACCWTRIALPRTSGGRGGRAAVRGGTGSSHRTAAARRVRRRPRGTRSSPTASARSRATRSGPGSAIGPTR